MSEKFATIGSLFRSRSTLAAFVAAGALSLAGACSDDGGGGAAEGDSCSETADCAQDLVCTSGVCSSLSNNGGGPDAGDSGGGTDADDPEPVEPEEYLVSYTLEDTSPGGDVSLHVYSSIDDSSVQVSPEDRSCRKGCWLSEDMNWFVWAGASGAGPAGSLDIFKAPVSDMTVEASTTMIAEGVEVASVTGNVVTYRRRGNDDRYTAYFLDLSNDTETVIGGLGSAQTTIGGWHVSPKSNTGIVFDPNLQTLGVKVGTLDGLIENTAFTVDAENYQEVSGGYFGSSTVAAVSPDGKLAAFVTQAPNDYGPCSSASDCSGPVKRCGRFDRCTALETTVHFMDLENLGELGGACGGAGTDTCAAAHECFQPGEEVTSAKCIPRRVVLGMPRQPAQQPEPGATALSGCELTQDVAGYFYTSFKGPLSFDSQGNLYGVGVRDCTDERNMPVSDILKIDPRSGEYRQVYGNPDAEGYQPDLCWDQENQEPDDESCIVYIDSARLSPQGNELAFVATNPNVAEPRLASDNLDLWTVLRNGEEHAWVGNNPEWNVVNKILAVHPPQ